MLLKAGHNVLIREIGLYDEDVNAIFKALFLYLKPIIRKYFAKDYTCHRLRLSFILLCQYAIGFKCIY